MNKYLKDYPCEECRREGTREEDGFIECTYYYKCRKWKTWFNDQWKRVTSVLKGGKK